MKWQPTPILLPGKSHGWRSLVGYSPWGCKESDTPERLCFLSFWCLLVNIFIGWVEAFSTQSEKAMEVCKSKWKPHYKPNYWRWWNPSWDISNPKRWCCYSTALNMPTNLENSAMEKIVFYSNSILRQLQRKIMQNNAQTTTQLHSSHMLAK